MKFYKRDPDAALVGMAELSLQERGAYNTILDLLYSRDGILPDDDEMLRRCLHCHGNEWSAVKSKLIKRGKIWVSDGYIMALRVDETIKDAANFSETQRKRAEKRWEIERKRTGNLEKTKHNQCADDAKCGNASIAIATATATAKEERLEAPPSAVPAKRGTRLNENWTPSSVGLCFAVERVGEGGAQQELEKFRDYWTSMPGQKGLKLDWEKTWRNWIRNANPGNYNGHRGSRALQDDTKSVSKAIDRLATAAERGELKFAPRPSLLPVEGESNLRVLPPRRSTG